MENIVIREVQIEDYEAVMNIRNPQEIYCGFDYLPDYYPVLMRRPNVRGFGAFEDGKLIAFVLAYLIDDGKVLFTTAARMSKTYRNRGMMTPMIVHVDQHYRPFIDSHCYGFSDAAEKLREIAFAGRGGNKFLFRKALYVYKEKQDYIMEQLEIKDTTRCVKYLSKRDIAVVFDSEKLCKEIFPENRIFVDHVSYRLLKSNILYILSHRCLVLGTNIDSKAQQSQRLLTAGNYMICPAGILYNIDIYGQNLSELYNHIFIHLRRLKGLTNMDIQVELICSEETEEQLCNSTMQMFGFKRIEFFQSMFYCAETYYKLLEEKQIPDYKAKL